MPSESPVMMSVGNAVLVMGAMVATAISPAQNAAKVLEEALNQLKSAPTLTLHLTGAEQRPSSVTTFNSMAWVAHYSDRTLLDIRESRNEVATRRTVADGWTRWTHDHLRNEYSANVYRRGEANRLESDRSLFKGIGSVLRGPESNLARILRDLYGDEYARGTEWLPSSPLRVLGAPQVDVVVEDRVFAPTPTQMYLYASRDDDRKRSIAFYLEWNDVTEVFDLKRIYIADRTSAGVLTDLLITIWAGSPVPENQFQFTLPAGARPIVGEGSGFN